MFRQKFSTSSALFGSAAAIELEDLFRRYGSDVLAYGSELTVLTFQDSDDIGHTFYKNQKPVSQMQVKNDMGVAMLGRNE